MTKFQHEALRALSVASEYNRGIRCKDSSEEVDLRGLVSLGYADEFSPGVFILTSSGESAFQSPPDKFDEDPRAACEVRGSGVHTLGDHFEVAGLGDEQ